MKKFMLISALFLSCFISSKTFAAVVDSSHITWNTGNTAFTLNPFSLFFPVNGTVNGTANQYTDFLSVQRSSTDGYLIFYNKALMTFTYNGTNSLFWTNGGYNILADSMHFHCTNMTYFSGCSLSGSAYQMSNPPTQIYTVTNSSQDLYNGVTKTFIANYPPQTHQLTVNLNPTAGGTLTGSQGNISCTDGKCTGNYYGNLSLLATPVANESFGYWDDGTICSTDNPLVVNMSSDKTLNAIFYSEMKMPLPAEKHWLLSVEAGGQVQCSGGTDSYHTGNSYYAFDFTDNTQEDGHLEGTDVSILAVAGGTVTESSCDSTSWGCTVVINHGNNYSTRYAHMKTTPLVSQNDTVTRGQQIGIMGNTGNSAGIHLHFQIYHNGDSSSTNTAIKTVYLDGRKLDNYKVGCNNFYLSTNQ